MFTFAKKSFVFVKVSISKNWKMTSSSGNKGGKDSKKVKKEVKEAKPMTKIIIRRLPPKLDEKEFLEVVDPLPEYDYFRFVIADELLGPNAFAR